jgi:hypothetical protein
MGLVSGIAIPVFTPLLLIDPAAGLESKAGEPDAGRGFPVDPEVRQRARKAGEHLPAPLGQPRHRTVKAI